ncbi:hypothetical protein C488_03560 [Natrinema pellirubrum DSM 15624]|uniref:Uncharacterized protein n=1 Tax=Natrinema pellirubrum (strain DSM 15624 / CIP 106293 / JCM 10476 / NCIMB 786 / 157) TaxID=797303 RepID=L0JGY9_NATP1|nr:hypothetical protein [Natrinema pellirubrum]AGB30780.1 hypothetical protein Natpe_0863 [Natrinema pellirubrum DSM 15624]ELY80834.1 hypothetical protein C488_03560 [Natrinema pellirubrum DSM 15624]
MRFKPVPEPPADVETLETVYRALPTRVDDIDDCCAHLVEETPIEDREKAATWLTFLRALELAVEESGSFRRLETDSSGGAADLAALDRDRLGRAFRARVDGADAVCAALEAAVERGSTSPGSQIRQDADEALTVSEVIDTLGDDRAAEGRRSRRNRVDPERVERLLEWAVLLGLAERADDGYRVALTRE